MSAKNKIPRAFFLAVVFLPALIFLVPPRSSQACFSIIVGKNASVDGYVILGHNEDDASPQIVNHHKIPRRQYSPGEKVTLLNSGQIDQVEQTWAYIWSEMPEMIFSDSYINEWGLSITSDSCPSREDKPEITDGGIGYMLRRLVAERARTAREGVLLAGSLVERFGYIGSGRTYLICDPDEGWLFCAVNGKHWLAQRVADDEVAIVANTYTVRQVDLSDKDNFLASKDIVQYAVSRSWYNLEKDGPFDFAAAYADPKASSSQVNLGRQWVGLQYVTAKSLDPDRILPFSVTPRQKIGVADMMRILRHDKQGQKLPQSAQAGNPAAIGWPISRGTTQTSFVVQLRKDMPLDIGIVYWMCLDQPRTSFYIPFHFGLSEFPAGFASSAQRPSRNFYTTKIRSAFRADPLNAFWTFSNFREIVYDAPDKIISRIKAQAEEIEKNAFAMQGPLEKMACELYPEDQTTAGQLLANYSNGIYLSCLEAMSEIIVDLEDE